MAPGGRLAAVSPLLQHLLTSFRVCLAGAAACSPSAPAALSMSGVAGGASGAPMQAGGGGGEPLAPAGAASGAAGQSASGSGGLGQIMDPPSSASPGSLTFSTVRVDDQFWGEAAAMGDLDGDGHTDVIVGPWAWAGPDFESKWQFRDYDTGADFFKEGHYDPFGMADSWAAYAYDVNGDGRLDPISKGHPGRASASWFENTGKREKLSAHAMHDDIAFEQNLLSDVTGDGKPEMIAGKDGRVGFFAGRWSEPNVPWDFHAVSEAGPWGTNHNFYHGIGVGDMNADGRIDVLHNTGWDEQPASSGAAWTHHDVEAWPGHSTGVQFGGAHMFGYDVDGDGDTDMVTSLNSHGYGLAWWEQSGDTWERHLIFGEPGQDTEHPDISISQVHALVLADMDADGLLDIVTGKSYWAHPDAPGTPESEDAGGTPYLYVFRLARGPEKMFEAHLVSDVSGVGRQFSVGDLNGDGVLDIVVGNKLGTFVHFQRPHE